MARFYTKAEDFLSAGHQSSVFTRLFAVLKGHQRPSSCAQRIEWTGFQTLQDEWFYSLNNSSIPHDARLLGEIADFHESSYHVLDRYEHRGGSVWADAVSVKRFEAEHGCVERGFTWSGIQENPL